MFENVYQNPVVKAEESKASQRDINCCAAIGSPRFDGMDSLTLPFQGKGLTYASDIDGKVYGFMGDYIYARLRDDGLITSRMSRRWQKLTRIGC